MSTEKLKFAVVAYLAGALAIYSAMFWNVRESIRKGYSDFAIYYAAGSMVRQGLGHKLYDEAIQFKVQREFAPAVTSRLGALPYNHPPFEALLFVPFTYLPYPVAFLSWGVANLAMLITLPTLLRPLLPEVRNYPWPIWMLASLAFFPIFVALLQGQDAILLLWLYALAFVCLKKNRDGFAGVPLALGLFKPHLVLPFVLLLLAQGRKKILSGFALVSALLAVASLAIVGGDILLSYPGYVLHLENTLAAVAIVPRDMPNLRGMMNGLLPRMPHVDIAIILISLALLAFATFLCRKTTNEDLFNLKFSLGAIATVLISYHAMIYDLSLLIVPVFLVVNELLARGGFHGFPSILATGAVLIFFCPPLLADLCMRDHQAELLGWVLLAWLSGIAMEISSTVMKRSNCDEREQSVNDL